MKTEYIRARIEPEIKEQAESILNEIGISTTDALRMFYKSIIRENGIPFKTKIPNAETKQAIYNLENGINTTTYNSVDEMFEAVLGEDWKDDYK